MSADPNPAATAAMSAGEKAKSQRSLVCLVQGLVGRRTTIELRDRSAVYGRIESVDTLMNVALKSATLYPCSLRERPQQHFDDFFVVGRLIRYVHVPDDVDGLKVIETQLRSFQTKRPPRKYNAGNREKRKQKDEDALSRYRQALQEHRSRDESK